MNRLLAALAHRNVFMTLAMMLCPFVYASAQTVDLSSGPLYASKQANPNVIVTTSVEFPTVGAAYLNVQYLPGNTYQGYFNSNYCYLYDTGNGGYFYPSLLAVNHACATQAFSGNFMNWLTMSAIDEFRFAMTGGNRVDETGPLNGTIIQRAYLPDGSINGVPDFYALGSNFPRHAIGANGYIDGYASSRTSDVLPTFSYGLLNLFTTTDASIIYMTNCKTQLYFSQSSNGNCANPANELGTFNVRVNVCNTLEGPLRSDLCLQYGGITGKYKPVGQVEVNADRMRFAVFGYLMDHDVPSYNAPCNDNGWNRCRYGGVLRSPMKYVGPTTYDANLTATTNANAEIDTQGRLIDDPEGNAGSFGGANSGFINYINKFGSSGVYKRLDPAGEMFYEAIRYYQNLGPTDLALANLPGNTAAKRALYDNFPVIAAPWVDPIIASCSNNYIINLSDANTWDDTYLPGYNGTPNAGYGRPASRAAEGGLDAYAWTAKIAALETDTTIPRIAADQNDLRRNLGGIATSNTANNASWAVAGAAYWANTNDIRADKPGARIKTISVDVAEASIDIHDRQLYLMGKYGGFNNNLDRASDTFAEPFFTADPANAQNPAIRSNSEWADSTGLPANYLLASSPDKLINGIRAAFSNIQAGSGTLSGAALTSSSLAYGASGAYIATFDPNYWSGTIQFKTIAVSGTTVTTSPTAVWDAGILLTTRCGATAPYATTCTDTDTSSDARNIVTTIRSGGMRVAKPFTWANVSVDSQYATVLNTNPATGSTDALGQSRLNYLRGYRLGETTSLLFRTRNSAMGDIINSAPVYAGAPTTTITDADYQIFFGTYGGRTPAVYFGANDGMMHALNASTGRELFAYIPNFVNFDLNDLTKPGYVHEPFVDAVPKVQEVKVNGAWRTVLVSGVGAGAQGVFALDVTDPTAFGPSNVVFEFSDADDSDLGNVMAAPEIVKLQTGTAGTPAVPTYGYFVAVTGYNNRRTTIPGTAVSGITTRTDSNVSADTNNKGVLFLLSLDRTLGSPWSLGTNYYKFTFPATSPTAANGLGPVASALNKDGSGSASALYFGDLQGSLWRLNTVGPPSAWVPSRGTATAPLPFFVATSDVAGTLRQPITARPRIATGPYNSQLIFFGTGRYIGSQDIVGPYAQQSEYALIDGNQGTLITRSTDLAARTATLNGSTVAVTGPAFTYSGTSSKKGWVLDFPATASLGERSITQPSVSNGVLSFTTLTVASNVCGAGGGYVYQLNALTGLPFLDTLGNVLPGGAISTVGIPGPPQVIDLALVPGQPRSTGETIGMRTTTTLVSGTAGTIKNPVGSTNVKAPPIGRVSWREITNYNDQVGR